MMTVDELGLILKKMYDHAPPRERNTQFYLFGIKYAHELSEKGKVQEVVRSSGIRRKCENEIYAGRRLAQYVDLKPRHRG